MFEKTEQRHRIFSIYEPTKINFLSEIAFKVWNRIITNMYTYANNHTSLQNQWLTFMAPQTNTNRLYI